MKAYTAKGNMLDLKKEIGGGQEAVVYEIDATTVAKIYRSPNDPFYANNTDEQQGAKTRLAYIQSKLTQFPKQLPSQVISPREFLFNGKKQLIGYTMPFIDHAYPLMLLGDVATRTRQRITNNNVVSIFENLHTTVAELHRKQVIIGDFNDMNILVKNNKAFCIDTDSYQFGQFPCTMYTAKYVDPLHCTPNAQGVLEMNIKHDALSDWYAYTTLLFRSLLLIDPYGGIHKPANPALTIKNNQRVIKRVWAYDPEVKYPPFVYPIETLPKSMREYFHDVFTKDRRELFPSSLLTNMHWQACTTHHIEYATVQCPICHPVSTPTIVILPKVGVGTHVGRTSIFKTSGTILYATYNNGKLHYLYHENDAYYREDGNKVMDGPLQPLRYRILGEQTLFAQGAQVAILETTGVKHRMQVDTYRSIPVFDAHAESMVWAQNGYIYTPNKFGWEYTPQQLGMVVTDNSMLWTGRTFGFGYFTAGSILEGFTFSSTTTATKKVELPIIRGEIIDATCVFSDSLCWCMLQTKAGKDYINHAFAITSKGELLWHHSSSPDDHDWLETIRGKTAFGNDLFCATMDGIQRVRLNKDTSVEIKQFTETAQYVSVGDILHISHHGIYVQRPHEIFLITLQ